jgi:hypothetical protein
LAKINSGHFSLSLCHRRNFDLGSLALNQNSDFKDSGGAEMFSSSTHLRSIVDQDGAVILDLERNAMSTLNATGGYVWDGLQQGKALEAIISDLARETGTDVVVVDRDVRGFIEELKSKHLMQG